MNGTLSKSQRRRANKKARDSSLAKTTGTTTSVTTTRTVASNPATRSKRRNRRKSSSGSSQRSNPYLECILNPEIPGGKVPDLTSVMTGTAQLRFDTIVTTLADSYGVLLCPHPNAYQPFSNNSTAGTINFTGSTFYQWDMSNTIAAVYQSCRPVSASIEVEYIGGSTYDQGYLVAGTIPKQPVNFAGNAAQISAFLRYPGSESYPVRNGARVVWAPQDNSDYEFRFTNASTNVTNYPTIFVVGGGLATGCALKVSLILNLEVIPNTDTANIVSMDYSPVNPGMVSQAFNYLQSVISYSTPIFGEFAGPFIKPTARLLGQEVVRRTMMSQNRPLMRLTN